MLKSERQETNIEPDRGDERVERIIISITRNLSWISRINVLRTLVLCLIQVKNGRWKCIHNWLYV